MADGASVAFTMNKGDISNPVQTARGGAVLMLSDRQEPTADEFAKGSQQTRDSLLQAKRDQAFQVFAAGLRERMEKDGKIRVNKEEMNRLMSRVNDQGE
jgi:peptidyl-prolyl cis-trans isomerase D